MKILKLNPVDLKRHKGTTGSTYYYGTIELTVEVRRFLLFKRIETLRLHKPDWRSIGWLTDSGMSIYDPKIDNLLALRDMEKV